MDWPEKSPAGFALAATIAQDSEAVLAKRGLHQHAQPELYTLAHELARLDKSTRRERVRQLVAAFVDQVDQPTRATRLSLLRAEARTEPRSKARSPRA